MAYGDGHLDVTGGTNAAAGRPGSSVREVSPRTGFLTTLAGTGDLGPLGDGRPAVTASLSNSCGIAVDTAGGILIADTWNGRVRLVAG